MGIPHYFHVITKNYPGVIHLTKPAVCSHYFLDFNGLIHHSAHEIIKTYANDDESFDKDIFEKNILEDCWKYLNYCVGISQPKTMVHLCIDGVAPIAKMNQQRKRRFLSVFQAKLKNEKRLWDTNAISPGTHFMSKLKSFLSGKIRDTPSKQIYFLSGADDPGEGEHKIMARIASLKNDEVIYIYGLDADLIMLSLLSHHKNIYLMREPQHSGGEITVHKDNTEDGFIYLNIDALRTALIQELHMTYNWPLSEECKTDSYSVDAHNCIETYVVMCFLLGNDFLPHIPCLSLKKNGHNRILGAVADAWKIYQSPCVENGVIHSAFLLHVLQTLEKDETSLTLQMNAEYLKKQPYSNREENADPSFCYPLQQKYKDPLAEAIYKIPSQNISIHWRSLYYKHMFHTKTTHALSKIITESSRLYMNGVYWTYAYYKRLPRDATWYYPFGYSPTIQDLANTLQGNINEWENLLEKWKETGTVSGFVDPIVQLMSILPYESKELFPYNIQKLLTDPALGCTHLFPESYPIQTYLKTHLWECTPVLPHLDIQRIQKSMKEFI
jgi:5'-3' exoribonuclease 1